MYDPHGRGFADEEAAKEGHEGEKKPLNEATIYNPRSTFINVHEHVSEASRKWRSHRLSTLQVFTYTTGTVFTHPVLWVEQFVTTFIFFTVTCCIVYYPPANYDNWVNTTEGNIQSFTTLLSALAGFLLSFYVTLCINRWWDLRINGVGKIWDATSELNLFISRCATDEEDELLLAIRRYARASLLLICIQHKDKELIFKELEQTGLLHRDELEKLTQMTNVAECIWTWITEIVTMLHKEGKIKEAPLYTFLLGKCNDGRSAAARIAGFLSTHIPLIYVHLLCYMVKLHNLLLALLLAMLGSSHFMQGRWFLFVQVVGRIFLMPLVYNSILLICELLQDPFEGDLGDFPLGEYLDEVDSKAAGYVLAGKLLPDLLKKRRDGTGP